MSSLAQSGAPNRRAFLLLAAILLTTLPAAASVSVKPSTDKPGTVNVAIVDAPLSEAVAALEFRLPFGVDIRTSTDPHVTFRARNVMPEGVLRALALLAKVDLVIGEQSYTLRDHNELGVTLDVKDAEVRDILKIMQTQCGIRNLLIDPGVQGKGTFLFTNVPCRIAFDTVLRSLGLTSVTYPNSVVTVGSQVH
ncbi:MAG: hypothetical protein ACXVIJ_13620 [Thermoanaerobaculia bacterium]